MKHLAMSVALALTATAALASGSGGGGGGGMSGSSPSMSQDPHQQAVGYYNSGERQMEKATKANADLKANTDASKADSLKSRLNKSLENAAADFQRAIKADASLYQAYSELGFCLRKLGRYDEALQAYDKGLAIEPRWAPGIEYRAEAYLGLNRIEDAKAAYTSLFGGDRARADILFESMKQWVAEHRVNANGVDTAQVDQFAKWVDERTAIHAQTVASASRDGIRSW
jgi:tetratricopeptide (TPR) repeat protein